MLPFARLKCCGPSLPAGFSTSKIWRLTSLMSFPPVVKATLVRAPSLHNENVQARRFLHLSRGERSDCEAIRVRGYGLTRDRNPSPVSHLTMRADLSLRER